MTKLINHPTLGEITVCQSRRSRRISLSVRPPGKIRLSYPYGVTLNDALKFMVSKEEWLERTLEKYSHKRPELISVPYSTRAHELVLVPTEKEKISVRTGDGKIIVSYPFHLPIDSDEVQTAARKGIEEAWKHEAKNILPSRLSEISRKTGLKFRSVTIRNTVSKWGSCSARDDISLSIHLMRLPNHLIDYILIHELCHTVHKNHGPDFHALLNHHTEGLHKNLRKELRNYHTRW